VAARSKPTRTVSFAKRISHHAKSRAYVWSRGMRFFGRLEQDRLAPLRRATNTNEGFAAHLL